jgi:hypothetical protein
LPVWVCLRRSHVESSLATRKYQIVNRDFYATMAQVLPVLLLALVWDSMYLERLRQQTRRSRRVDPSGVLFWTKPRVRVYSLFVTSMLIMGIGVSMLVLAGVLADGAWLRGVLVGGLILGLVTLQVRIGSDIVSATRS